jgi:hypothetical protein
MLKGWQARGECARLAAKDPKVLDKVFFPHKGRPTNNPEFKKYCEVCPVVQECLDFAIAHSLDGVWGNTTRAQRDLLLSIMPELADTILEQAKLEGWYDDSLVHPIHRVRENYPTHSYILTESSLDPDNDLLSQEDFLLEDEWDEYQQTILHIAATYEGHEVESLEEVLLPNVLPPPYTNPI